MPRLITANLNGIRSAASKGFFTWLADQQADVVIVLCGAGSGLCDLQGPEV